MGVIMVYYSGVDCSLVSGKGTGFLITVYSYIHNALAVNLYIQDHSPQIAPEPNCRKIQKKFFN